MNNVHSRVSNVRNDEECLVVCDDAPTLWDCAGVGPDVALREQEKTRGV
jgi:hypothetical protein